MPEHDTFKKKRMTVRKKQKKNCKKPQKPRPNTYKKSVTKLVDIKSKRDQNTLLFRLKGKEKKKSRKPGNF